MINSLNIKQLNIVLPNTNKALSEALNSASPKELKSLSSFGDLKSMMNSILKQSTDPNFSNKVLLELVKNNPTLKNLGSVSSTIKDLLKAINFEKNPSPIEKTIKHILVNIKDLKGQDLKEKFINPNTLLKNNYEKPLNIDKIIKNILSQDEQIKEDLKQTKKEQTVIEKSTKILSKDIKNIKIDKQFTDKPLKNDTKLEKPSIKKSIKELLNDLKTSTDTKNIDIKKEITPEKIIKNFLTDIKDLKGNDLKQKLIQLSDFLQSNLKNIKNSSSALKDIVSDDLKTLLSEEDKTDNTKKSLPIEKTLKKFLLDIKDLKGSELKHKFINSGVFLESNIKDTKGSPEKIKDILTNDLKVVLAKASEEISNSTHTNQQEVLKHIDKLSLQIDHYQLLSYLSNSSSLYLPFSWEQLQEGNIEIKKLKNDRFYCDIDLKLKDYGALNLKLTLYETNQINIHIYSENEYFKSLVKENIASLRCALIGVNVTPREIRLFQPKPKTKNQSYGSIDDNLQMGFEIKA